MELYFKKQVRFQFIYDFFLFWISTRVIEWHMLYRFYCVRISCFSNSSACKGALNLKEIPSFQSKVGKCISVTKHEQEAPSPSWMIFQSPVSNGTANNLSCFLINIWTQDSLSILCHSLHSLNWGKSRKYFVSIRRNGTIRCKGFIINKFIVHTTFCYENKHVRRNKGKSSPKVQILKISMNFKWSSYYITECMCTVTDWYSDYLIILLGKSYLNYFLYR